jgi:hypothetical protein
MVVGGRHRFENDDLLAKKIDDQPAAIEKVGRELRLPVADHLRRAIDFVVDLMQPELRRLMRRLKQPLLGMRQILGPFLKSEQLRHANVAFVVGIALTFEDGPGVRHAQD